LEITTRRPQFSKVTRVVAYPDNPVLEAKFVRDGTVRSVRILKSSGFPDVDQPVIDAVFAWTAKGEALRKLPVNARTPLTSAPNAPSTLGIGEADEPGIVIKFTIILR
jgi:TonB family protein